MANGDLVNSAAAHKPGEAAFRQARALGLRQLMGVLTALAVLLGSWYVLRTGWLVCTIELAALAAMLLIDRLYSGRVDNWLQGARGEKKVGEILESLSDDGWFAVHDVFFRRGNIDHVVVGPGGLFIVETKSRKGRLRPEWVRDEHLNQAWAEARSIERVTGQKAQPLLVFSDAYLIGRGIFRRKGVVVLSARMLKGFFARQRPQFSHERIGEVHTQLLVAAGVE